MTDSLCPPDASGPLGLPVRAAAVCYRRTSGQAEFLLVRTRTGEAWTFPKGHLEPGESVRQAADREAREEAGAFGQIASVPLTRYRYPAWIGPGMPEGEVCVEAYLLEVTSRARSGSVERRRTAWFTPEKAVKKLAEGRHPAYAAGLARVIVEAEAAIQGRSGLGPRVVPEGSEH